MTTEPDFNALGPQIADCAACGAQADLQYRSNAATMIHTLLVVCRGCGQSTGADFPQPEMCTAWSLEQQFDKTRDVVVAAWNRTNSPKTAHFRQSCDCGALLLDTAELAHGTCLPCPGCGVAHIVIKPTGKLRFTRITFVEGVESTPVHGEADIKTWRPA